MFSVDDSFDLDDEIFLEVDATSTCGKQHNDAHVKSHIKEQPNIGSSAQSSEGNVKQNQNGFGNNCPNSLTSKTEPAVSESELPSSFFTGNAVGCAGEPALSNRHVHTFQKPSVSTSPNHEIPSTSCFSRKDFLLKSVKIQEPKYQNKIAQQEQNSASKKFIFKPITAVKSSLLVPSPTDGYDILGDIPCSLSVSSVCSRQLSASSNISNSGTLGKIPQSSASKLPVSKDLLFDSEEDSWLSNLNVSLDNSSVCNMGYANSALKNSNQQTSTPVKLGPAMSPNHVLLNLLVKDYECSVQKPNRQNPLTTNCHVFEDQVTDVTHNTTVQNMTNSNSQIKRSDSKILGSVDTASKLQNLKNACDNTVISNSGLGGQHVSAMDISSAVTKVNAHARKRKFPGPAGALPEANVKSNSAIPFAEPQKWQPLQTKPLIQVERSIVHTDVFCSQKSEDKFSSGPWQVMKEDLEPQAKDILQEFNISSIIKKASKKLLPRSKVPVLCVIIDQISLDGMEASVILGDPTGKINGTIHRLIVKEHTMDMQPGTVMVLRQVAVFSPPAVRSHYLNITPNNLVRIYSKEDDKSAVSTKLVATFVEEDFKISDSFGSSLNKSPGPVSSLCPPLQALSKAVKGNNVNFTKTVPSTSTLSAYEIHACELKHRLCDAKMGQFPNTSSRLLKSSSVKPSIKACATSAGKKSATQQVPASSANSGQYSSSWNSAAQLQPSPILTSSSISDQAGMASLWQDDQLDDILSVIGDEELLAEC